MKNNYTDYINDILNAIDLIDDFIKDLDFDGFKEDVKTSSAVIRQLEVMGEASKKIPEEIRGKYPDVEWKKIAGMRDKLIHEYFGVDYEIVWKTIKEKLPLLKPSIKNIKANLEKNIPD